jgi:hypothetical protein
MMLPYVAWIAIWQVYVRPAPLDRSGFISREVRKVVNDYLAAHSQIMAWWLSGSPAG